jgi:hypothetical protein
MDTESTTAGVNLAIQPTSTGALNEWSYTSTPYMPLWRAQGPLTYASRTDTVDYIVEYVSK